ncbi:MAG: hypothetical protein ACTSSE_06325 [Candidatus Thorarchaeota archaeon]
MIDLFRIEEVLSHVTNELSYVHESVQLIYKEKNRDLHERQERLFLYLNILLGASILTEAINIIIALFAGTFEYLVVRYTTAFSTIAIFVLIIARILKKSD